MSKSKYKSRKRTIIGYTPKKGTLSRYGYKNAKHLSLNKRRKALKKAINAYNKKGKNGRNIVVRKLNLIHVYNRKRHPTTARLFKQDMKWVQRHFKSLRSSKSSRRRKRKSSSKSRKYQRHKSSSKSRKYQRRKSSSRSRKYRKR